MNRHATQTSDVIKSFAIFKLPENLYKGNSSLNRLYDNHFSRSTQLNRMATLGQVRGLSIGLKAMSTLALVTGLMDVCLGKDFVEQVTGPINASPEAVALIDSQMRYLGSIWAGYGSLLWWTSNNLQSRRHLLPFLGGSMLLGGVGRLVSGLSYGFAPPVMAFFTGLELVLPPLVWLLIYNMP